jgi:hypothetical protein
MSVWFGFLFWFKSDRDFGPRKEVAIKREGMNDKEAKK